MKQGLTELVFIVDMSGSMHGLVEDTIGGYNSLLDAHRKEEGECLVTTVFFNDDKMVIHDRVPISEVKNITEHDYMPCGCTALVDAFAGTISHIAQIHKYARAEDIPQNTVFTVITDGLENASHRYSSEDLRKKVEKEKSEYGWQFFFIGANMDSFAVAGSYGLDKDMIANFKAEKGRTRRTYDSFADASVSYRRYSPLEARKVACGAIYDMNEEFNKDE